MVGKIFNFVFVFRKKKIEKFSTLFLRKQKKNNEQFSILFLLFLQKKTKIFHSFIFDMKFLSKNDSPMYL